MIKQLLKKLLKIKIMGLQRTNRSEESRNLDKIQFNTEQSMSPDTVVYINTTGKRYEVQGRHNLHFFAFTALENCVIDVSECATNTRIRNASGTAGAIEPTIVNSTADIAIPVGVTIYGKFLSLELSQGKGIAYAREATPTLAEV